MWIRVSVSVWQVSPVINVIGEFSTDTCGVSPNSRGDKSMPMRKNM